MLKKTCKITISILIFLHSTVSCANKGHEIKVQVQGISDTSSYLAYHFGERQYLKDTVDVDSDGRFVFSGDERLPGGMYMIAFPDDQYFEVIIDKNQHFEIEAEANRFTETIKFKDSPENTSFYEYIRFIRKKSEEVRPIRQELNDPSISDERRDLLREKSEVIDHEVKDKREAHIEKFPDCVFSMVLKNHREIPMPETVVGEDGKPDHDASYREYKKKYWQYIDFDDERILRTPVYHSKLKNYFENIVIKHPDTVKREADRIIDSTRGNNEIFEYTVWFLTNKYERSQIMGLDAVFVYLVENYYKTGEVFWLDDDRLNNIIERAKRLKPTLIGKTAPDIKMYLPDKSPKNLHDVEAKYTVIYFWDTECPHCKTKTPKLKDLYEKYKNYGLKIFAVNTQTDSEKWLNYVEKNNLHDWVNVNDARNKSGFRDKYDIYSIPLVFLLDENKKIIAKHIGIEQVQEIISRDLEEK